MGKIDKNKQIKRESLLETAFNLFTSKGIHKTSISDIVDNAGVAKGTFYLYFQDKYDIRNKLIAHKSGEVFRRADLALKETDITDLEETMFAWIVSFMVRQGLQGLLLRFCYFYIANIMLFLVLCNAKY